MITEHDLKAAIAECQGKRNPDANTCIKLAAFYTIQKAMFGEPEPMQYSYSPPPTIEIESKSEFAEIVNGKEPGEVMPVIDELMETLKVIQPRLYDAVINKLT